MMFHTARLLTLSISLHTSSMALGTVQGSPSSRGCVHFTKGTQAVQHHLTCHTVGTAPRGKAHHMSEAMPVSATHQVEGGQVEGMGVADLGGQVLRLEGIVATSGSGQSLLMACTSGDVACTSY